MPIAISRPKCRLCRCPVVDGGVSLSEVDKDKLANWWLTRRGVPIDKKSIAASWVCLNCVREANFKHECSNKRDDDCVWWPEMDPYYKYFLEGSIKSCSVSLRKLSTEEIQKHLKKTPHSSQLFTCSFHHCQSVFPCESKLKNHFKNFHMGMKIFVYTEHWFKKCQFCSLPLSMSKEPESHFNPASCGICNDVFYCSGLYEKHKADCSLECDSRDKIEKPGDVPLNPMYCCPSVCNFFYWNRQGLIEHIQKVHFSPLTSIEKCSTCCQVFPDRGTLETHYCKLRLKPACFHCGLSMYKEYWLFHSIKEKCEHCNEWFPCKGLYLIHKTQSRSCTLCLMMFCNNDLLEDHLSEVHSVKLVWQQLQYSERELKCNSCRTYFKDDESRFQHIHAKHLLAFCNLCGSLFRDTKTLDYHLNKTHGVKSITQDFAEKCSTSNQNNPSEFTCTLCNISGLKKKDLQSHLKKSHPVYNIPFTPEKQRIPKTHEKRLNPNSGGLAHKAHRAQTGGPSKNVKGNGALSSTGNTSPLIIRPLKKLEPIVPLCGENVFRSALQASIQTSLKRLEGRTSSAASASYEKQRDGQEGQLQSIIIVLQEEPLQSTVISPPKKQFIPPPPTNPKMTFKPLVNNFFCSACDFKHPERFFVEKHAEEVHLIRRANNSVCPDCKRVFLNAIWRHNHICEGKSTAKCNYCNQSMYSENLPRHQLSADCAKCGEKFSCENLLRGHLHEEYICQFCDQLFCLVTSLRTHLEEIHNCRVDMSCWEGQDYAQSGAPCYKCKRFYPDEVHLALHQTEQHPQKLYCELCNTLFDGQSRLAAHFAQKHNLPEDSQYKSAAKCKICKESFSDNKEVVEHIKKIHLDKSKEKLSLEEDIVVEISCEASDEVMLEETAPELELMHTSEVVNVEASAFDCNVCGKEFESKELSEKHEKDENFSQLKINCLYCSASLSSIEELERHLMIKHNKHKAIETNIPQNSQLLRPQKNNFCFCNACFGSKKLLENHINLEHVGDKVTCKICKSFFTSFPDFELHIVLQHLDEFKNMFKKLQIQKITFTCDFCCLRFPHRDLLEEHISVAHLKIALTCNTCLGEFFTVEELKTHMKSEDHGTHASENPQSTYLCRRCNMKCISKPASESHIMLVHMSLDTYCSICYLNFKSWQALHMHIKRQHGQKKFKCEICERQFMNGRAFKRHRKRLLICRICYKRVCHYHTLKAHMIVKHGLELKQVEEADVIESEPTLSTPSEQNLPELDSLIVQNTAPDNGQNVENEANDNDAAPNAAQCEEDMWSFLGEIKEEEVVFD